MTVYVDEVRTYPSGYVKGQAARYGNNWSHLTADTLEELHEMAQRVGLLRSWFQNHSYVPHYDMVPNRRTIALDLGAIFKPAREQARERLRKRHEAQ